MITEAVVNLLVGLFTFLLDLMPDVTLPAWIGTSTTALGTALGHITLLDNWIPVQAIGHVVVFILGCFTVAFGVRVGRMLISLFTGGGGSAA